MALTSLIKSIIPLKLRPLAIAFYLSCHRRYFVLYRSLFGPNASYLAVAEQNYRTDFPPEWTSVCYEDADILVDLETDYSFKLNDVKFAYSGHTIEHLSDTAVKRLFKNMFISMKKGGVVRLECPDLDLFLDDYKCVHNRDRKVTKQMMALIESWNMPKKNGIYAEEHVKVLAGVVTYFDFEHKMALPPVCSVEEFKEKMATLSNREFGDWAVSLLTPEQLRTSHEHRNWFNFEKLQKLLAEAGFSGVVKCEPGETRYNFRMNINRKHRSWCSMYVEAIKS